MKYVALTGAFGLEHLTLQSAPDPSPGDGEVLVRMKAASLNYVDLAIVTGRLDPNLKLPFIPVADGSGVVEDVGQGVDELRPGDRVATLYIPSWSGGRYMRAQTTLGIRSGAGSVPGQLAEFKVFRTGELIRIPDALSFEEASTLPIAGLTAWNALAYGRLKPGDTVLLHGTGGVSIFALQFAKATGARVIITSRSDEKRSKAQDLGADFTINYERTPELEREVRRLTNGEGVDVVVETVGGSNLTRSLRSLRPQGHISVVGFLEGAQASIDLIALNMTLATITGVSVGSTDDLHDMLAAIDATGLKPVIDEIFPLDETIRAFEHLQGGEHFGKIVIRM